MQKKNTKDVAVVVNCAKGLKYVILNPNKYDFRIYDIFFQILFKPNFSRFLVKTWMLICYLMKT